MTIRELLKEPGQEQRLADLLLTSVVIFESQPEDEILLLRGTLPILLRHLARTPDATLDDLAPLLEDVPLGVLDEAPGPPVCRRWAALLQGLLQSRADEVIERLTVHSNPRQ